MISNYGESVYIAWVCVSPFFSVGAPNLSRNMFAGMIVCRSKNREKISGMCALMIGRCTGLCTEE